MMHEILAGARLTDERLARAIERHQAEVTWAAREGGDDWHREHHYCGPSCASDILVALADLTETKKVARGRVPCPQCGDLWCVNSFHEGGKEIEP